PWQFLHLAAPMYRDAVAGFPAWGAALVTDAATRPIRADAEIIWVMRMRWLLTGAVDEVDVTRVSPAPTPIVPVHPDQSRRSHTAQQTVAAGATGAVRADAEPRSPPGRKPRSTGGNRSQRSGAGAECSARGCDGFEIESIAEAGKHLEPQLVGERAEPGA